MSNAPTPIDLTLLCVRGLSIETLFRYTNTFDRAVAYVKAGKIDVKPLITKTFAFKDSIAAYEYASAGHPEVIKVMIDMEDN
jgi:D-xylulose reductase